MKISKVTSIRLRDFLKDARHGFDVICELDNKYKPVHDCFDVEEKIYTFNVKEMGIPTFLFEVSSITIRSASNSIEERNGTFEVELFSKDLDSDTKDFMLNLLKEIDAPFFKKYQSELTNDRVIIKPFVGISF